MRIFDYTVIITGDAMRLLLTKANLKKTCLLYIVAALIAVQVGAALPSQRAAAAAGKVLPASNGSVYFGLKKHDGYAAGADAFLQLRQAQIGRNYAYERIFFAVGEWENKNLTDNQRLSSALAQGRIPMVSFAISKNNWATYAAGTNDAVINALADKVKALNAPMWVTIVHEPDNKACLLSNTTCTTGPKTDVYVNMWRRFHTIFTNRGVTNATWNWIVMSYSFGPYATAERKQIIKDLYPGDAYVDWISADPYNFIQTNNTGVCPFWRNDPTMQNKWDSSWKSLGKEMQEWYDWSSARGKPLALAEFGVLHDPRAGQENHKAEWLRQAKTELQTKYPNIKAVSYFDNIVTSQSDNCDWRIDASTSPAATSPALTAFREMAQDPYFKQDSVIPPPPATTPIITPNGITAGQTLSGTVTLAASATHTSGINRVSFFYVRAGTTAETWIATDTTSPYSASLNTALLPNGSYSIRYKAFPRDLTASSTLDITVVISN